VVLFSWVSDKQMLVTGHSVAVAARVSKTMSSQAARFERMEHLEQDVDEANESSASESSQSPTAAESKRRAPGWVIHVLIVLGTVVGLLAGLNVWVQRQVLDTDEWVSVTDELLENDEVRGVLAAYLVDQLYESVDVAEELDTRLPDEIDALSGLLAAALRDPATDGVDRLLATDLVRGLWSNANEISHAALVGILKDETGPGLSTTDGVVTLELGELVKQVGLEFGLSSDVVDKLPDDVGSVTLFESEELAAAQDVVRVVEVLGFFLFLLVIVLYGAAIYLAGQRRREATREVGVALIVASVMALVSLRVGVGAIEGAVGDTPDVNRAARAAAVIGTELLRGIAMAGLAYGAIIAGYAALAGPSNVATRIRAKLSPVLLARPLVAWSASAGIFLLVVYLVPSEPLQSWWRGLIFIGVFATGLEALRQQLKRESAAAPSVSAAPEDVVPTGSDAAG
jgi:hypothetical protein